ncbi:diaminopimelate decarboxylase [Nitrosomonas sp. Nm51]|uniref:pyridoxal-dependent decarboxylase, exosortase A system-associated n=1 Tax=Nitrosomonas sp. Nm51 TaxID=133720 RepID=UPI0008C1C0A4|nr:pyridoxal-dependent decarboxylase, exosortase A system-associated [Nitrosomonas sp. Nm51]SER75162.1 diaminopimelate decarboxylase [Nitrosomonas sp. Nm51]
MTDTRSQHSAFTQFPVQNDCLEIGGIPLSRLAQRVGRTPFYAYDRKKITERIQLLRQSLPDDIHIHYAMKANPMPAVVQHLASLVDGIDVASAGEMRIALDTTMPAEHISFAGPGKTEHELSSAIAAGIVLNIESERELALITRLGDQLGIRPNLAIRINPDFELKSSGMKMGGGPKQFGIDAELVPALLTKIGRLDLNFIGFHIFSGSQNLKAEAIQETQKKTLQLGLKLAENAPTPVRMLNIGGGFGIPYFPGEKALDIQAIGQNLNDLLPSFKQRLPETRIVIELGRYIIAEAGIYVCRIIERKQSRGKTFLITDGGLHHHLAATGNFGQVIRKNYPVMIGSKALCTPRETVSVVGPLCTPLDLLAEQMEMAQAAENDLVVVLQSGAYGLTASPTAFLGHPEPMEVLV